MQKEAAVAFETAAAVIIRNLFFDIRQEGLGK